VKVLSQTRKVSSEATITVDSADGSASSELTLDRSSGSWPKLVVCWRNARSHVTPALVLIKSKQAALISNEGSASMIGCISYYDYGSVCPSCTRICTVEHVPHEENAYAIASRTKDVGVLRAPLIMNPKPASAQRSRFLRVVACRLSCCSARMRSTLCDRALALRASVLLESQAGSDRCQPSGRR